LTAKVSDMPVVNALVRWAALVVKESDVLGHNNPTRAEKREQAIEILALVLRLPTSWQIYKDSAARLLAELQTELSPEVVTAAQERGKSRSLDEVVAEIVGEG